MNSAKNYEKGGDFSFTFSPGPMSVFVEWPLKTEDFHFHRAYLICSVAQKSVAQNLMKRTARHSYIFIAPLI